MTIYNISYYKEEFPALTSLLNNIIYYEFPHVWSNLYNLTNENKITPTSNTCIPASVHVLQRNLQC